MAGGRERGRGLQTQTPTRTRRYSVFRISMARPLAEQQAPRCGAGFTFGRRSVDAASAAGRQVVLAAAGLLAVVTLGRSAVKSLAINVKEGAVKFATLAGFFGAVGLAFKLVLEN